MNTFVSLLEYFNLIKKLDKKNDEYERKVDAGLDVEKTIEEYYECASQLSGLILKRAG